ncbi:TIGR00730 family Rossman fold protein [Mycobacterium basiliense]|uniref:LOG family protein n=1 Tax=Mycobacterium basiliense TaxID=2094119 RepID=UPI001E50EBA3|nr:TIGR00730 family Rossman fold protein [Mycobacterium basiliense]
MCVYCASGADNPADLSLAATVGTEIGRRGWRLISGGGTVAMMGAVARAARSAGAHTTGVIPKIFLQSELADLDADELVVTDTLTQRKHLMGERADAFLTLPGGLGTLEELLESWTAASLGIHHKPVVLLDPAGHYRGLLDWLEELRQRGFVRASAIDRLVVTTDVDNAFENLCPTPRSTTTAHRTCDTSPVGARLPHEEVHSPK